VIAFTPISRPATWTGHALNLVVPFPSSPRRLSPQHWTPLESVMAHVWVYPVAMARTPVPRPSTPTGVELCRDWALPSIPLPPQHLAAAAVESAQVCQAPTLTVRISVVGPETTGMLAWPPIGVALPSSPNWLKPQQSALPTAVTAQVWEPAPAVEIARMPGGRPTTLTGVRLSMVLPLPSWPKWLNPQHLTVPELVRAQVSKPPAEIATTLLARPTT
jgi:hypothetical protein